MRYKTIFRRKQVRKDPKEKLVAAIHVELNLENFQKNFVKLMSVFSRKTSSFKDGHKMRFWAYSELVKSDKARGLLTRAYKRQKFFTKAMVQDYSSSILFLNIVHNSHSACFCTAFLTVVTIAPSFC